MRTLIPFFALVLGACSVTVHDLSAINSAVGDGIEARDGAGSESLLLHTQRVREMDQIQMEMNTFGDPTITDIQLIGPQLLDLRQLDPMVFDPLRDMPQGPNLPM
ncbi:MAG: hypothetical protein AB8H79_18170 [Myxococcota bacterium]